jgi:DNA polymerase-3 subunit alpha
MYGEIGQHIITGREEGYICDCIDEYIDIFGRENFFLEIQEYPDKPMQPRVNEYITNLSTKYGYGIVGTGGTYYLREDDAEIRDIISAVADGRDLDDPSRPTLIGGDYSMRSSRDMEELFVYAPVAYTTTARIADMIHLEIPYGGYRIPTFPLSPQEQAAYTQYISTLHTPIDTLLVHTDTVSTLSPVPTTPMYVDIGTEEWLLRDICVRALTRRYQIPLTESDIYQCICKIPVPTATKKLTDTSIEELMIEAQSSWSDTKKDIISKMSISHQNVMKRLEYELTVVHRMGFDAYFCIVSDFIRYAKGNGVPV